MFTRRRLAGLVVAVLLVAPFVARAQPLADKLPPDTIAYVGWAGTESMGDPYAKSHLKAVLDASNIPAVFTDFLPKVMEAVAKETPNEPEFREAMSLMRSGMKIYKHPFAYAFTGVDWQKKTPRIVFICDAGADIDELHKLTEKQAALSAQQGGMPFPMKVVRAGKLLVWTIGYANPEMELGLGVNGDGAGKNLANNAAFKAAFAQVNKSPAVAAYIDVQAAIRVAERGVAEEADPDFARQWPKVRDALGLPGIKSGALALGFDQKDWVTEVFIDAPAPRKGILAMFDPKPLDDAALKAIPQDAITAGVFQFDMAGLLGHVRNIAGEIEPSAPQQIDDALSQVNQMLEMDVEKDLFGAFGSQWAYYSSPSVGGQGILGTAGVNRLKDPVKAEQSLAKIVNLANAMLEQNSPDPKMKIRVKQTKVGDLTINYLGTPLITPSWAIKDGNLYVGLFPQIVAAAAKQGAGANGKSILENPKFTALRQRLGGKPVSAIDFADLEVTAPQSYGSWLAISRIVGAGDLFGIDSPAMVLPDLQTLMANLGPAGSATWGDEAGLHYRSLSPFPGSVLLSSDPLSQLWSSQAMMLPSILLPALNRARDQANRVQSMNNLRQIALACHNHANDNKGKFPDDIADLLKWDITPNTFVNPRAIGSQPPIGLDEKTRAAWVRENSDYVYAGAGRKVTDRNTVEMILAYEKPDGLTDGINIAFGDGHVEFVEMGRALQMIGPGNGAVAPLREDAPRIERDTPRPDRSEPRRVPPGGGL